MHRACVDSDRHPRVCVKGNDRGRGGAEGGVRDQKGELSIGSRDELEAAEDFGGHGFGGAELGGHGRAADGQRGRELHVERLSQVRRLGRSLLGVVHGHHLTHAAGQVAEEPRPDFRVHPLRGGQEAGDLVHALVESGSVFAQDRGVS